MANGRTRTTHRKINPWDVYDALPPPIRAAFQEGPQEWDVVWARTRLRALAQVMPRQDAIARVVRTINNWHASEIEDARPWQPNPNRLRKAAARKPSPHQLAQATMQTSNRSI